MFGLFYMFTNLIGLTISGTKRFLDNDYYKEQGWKEYNNGVGFKTHTYYDSEGVQRDLTTNNIMQTYWQNGDVFLRDTKTGKIRNLSEEKNLGEIEDVKKNNPNVKAILYKHWDMSNTELRDGSCRITGTVYRDVNDKQLYFERYITWRKSDYSKAGVRGDYCAAYFYLRISDGMIVSISDRQVELDKKYNIIEDYESFIEFFNSEQTKGGFVLRNRNKYAEGKKHFYLYNEEVCNQK